MTEQNAPEVVLRDLLEETLTDWRIDGTVVLSGAGCGGLLLRSGSTVLEILLAGPEEPGRWIVRERGTGTSDRSFRCASLVGVLTLVRRILGAESPEGRPLRLGAATAPR